MNTKKNIYIFKKYLYGSPRKAREAPWRQREATEASSRAQIMAYDTESSPLTIPPGPLKLRLLRKIPMSL